MRRIAIAAALLAAATLVGVAAQVGDAAPGVPRRATALGAPWLVAAFATGALLRRPLPAALGGAVLLAGGTIAYYATQLALTGHVRALSVGWIALGWAVAALAAGAAMGALGATWRTAARRPVTTAGALATAAQAPATAAAQAPALAAAQAPARAAAQAPALAAAQAPELAAAQAPALAAATHALATAVPAAALVGEALLLAGEWEGHKLLAAELALGAVLLPLCSWRRASLPAAALAACALAAAFAGAEAEVRDAMRAAGWRGA